MRDAELRRLEEAIGGITALAKEEGLDFFSMRYEVCPSSVIYSIGAYGMPTRFAHWSFGKMYHRMKTEYNMGLSKIYELVINSDPCYAFLLDSNTLLQNKLIVAHVLGHSDFFRRNAMFAGTDRRMVDRMAVFAERIREMEREVGADAVEACLDAGLAIQEHIDPYTRHGKGGRGGGGFAESDGGVKDVIGFIADESGALDDWKREILYMLREEMLYFWPQMETKILNEGWASYWHVRLLRRFGLSDAETVEFAKLHAGVTQPSPGGVNPYALGFGLLREIERRYGFEALFDVRETESDVSLLRSYLTDEAVESLDLYTYGRDGDVYRVTAKEAAEVKESLIRSRTNGGFPYLTVKDGDYRGTGGLLLTHRHEGLDLDRKYVERTLPLVYALWGKPVTLATVQDGVRVHHGYDGKALRTEAA